MKLQGQHIYLRAIEPQDIDVLYAWENDVENWTVSNTQTPFSRFVLEQYIASAHEDIYSAKQLRLIICDASHKSVGSIDLFDFDPNHQRAGVGVLIADKSDRKKGYASEALKLLIDYCFTTLNLHQLYCNITVDNESSIILFQKHGFMITGIKKQWIREGAHFKDELILQLIRS
ncbi:MAG: GNAT family N-acetyltransferase [Bacteroidetes bacterium]|nr:GNAT family N-acetyltransferase [Bacteroidota bacterium]